MKEILLSFKVEYFRPLLYGIKKYERIKKLNIDNISEIMYVNIIEPYYYFNIIDPDGNTLEICSDNYEEDKWRK